MIGKITIGKSFRGCLMYCLNDKVPVLNEGEIVKDRAEVLMYNKCSGNDKELVQQFNEVRQLNTKLSKPVLHITLSFSLGELLGKDKLMEMAEQCAKDFGFENNQFVAIAHRDTKHQHIHIVANRIGFDKRTVGDSNSYKKIANYCRKMELKYGLKQVLNPKRFLSKEQRNIPRFDRQKEHLKELIRLFLSKSNSYYEFEQQMKKHGYEITKGRGISFSDEKKVKVKGSELNYSLQTIERILEKKAMLQTKPALAGTGSTFQLNTPTHKSKSLPGDIKKDISKIIEQVIKPEQMPEPMNLLLKQNRKRKKKRSLHL